MVLAQNIDPVALDYEISKLNDSHEYETSLLKLDEIINNPASTHFDKTHAYIQSSYTYKRVYNYTMALSKLSEAELEAKKSTSHRRELETLVKVEQMFVHFDMQKYEDANRIISTLDEDDVSSLKRETRAFYYSVLGTMADKDGQLEQAEEFYDKAIDILKKENSKHLPNLYRPKLLLYGRMNMPEKAMDAFEKGLEYAERYEVDFYKMTMYEGLSQYYEQQKDYENAFKAMRELTLLQGQYNAHNVSGSLANLENKLHEHRQIIEFQSQKKIQYYLAILTGILVLLVFVLWKLLRVNQQKKKLVERENQYIRDEVVRLSNEIDTKTTSVQDLKSYGLTERQLEVVHCVKQGMTNKEIGQELFISENTVKYHLKAIYEIMGVDGRSELRQNY